MSRPGSNCGWNATAHLNRSSRFCTLGAEYDIGAYLALPPTMRPSRDSVIDPTEANGSQEDNENDIPERYTSTRELDIHERPTLVP